LPRAALGKAASAKIRSAKPPLPRAVYRALGKGFAESPRGSRQRKGAANGPLPLTPSLPRAHLADSQQRVSLFLKKNFLPRASVAKLSANIFLFVFFKKYLPRTLLAWLSANIFPFF
jgi:hypothetical protein